jgi:hypothetical protein
MGNCHRRRHDMLLCRLSSPKILGLCSCSSSDTIWQTFYLFLSSVSFPSLLLFFFSFLFFSFLSFFLSFFLGIRGILPWNIAS